MEKQKATVTGDILMVVGKLVVEVLGVLVGG